jgi:hypothetical protein
VQPGGACTMDEECAGGWCDARPDACPGTCHALGSAGAGCSRMTSAWSSRSDDRLCAAGFVCEGGGCRAVGRPGPHGAPCRQDEECNSGLVCLTSQGEQSGTCGVALTAGEHCMGSLGCATGLYCKSPASACAPGSDEGGSCEVGRGVIPWLHSPVCKGNQVCVGDTTITNDRGDLSTPGTCRTPQGVGGPCVHVSNASQAAFLSGCLLGLACDPQTSRCVAAPGVGTPCSREGACAPDAYCLAGTCTALLPDGAACFSSSECQQLYCSGSSPSHICGAAPACHES